MGKRLIGSVGLAPGSDSGFDLDTKGQIHGYTSTQYALDVGTSNQSLLVDSSATAGIKWGASATSVLSATGDILYASGANTLAKLAKGDDDEILTLKSGLPSWETASGGGGKLELVGTQTALRTSGGTGGYDDLHLSFTAIDMTAVTELIWISYVNPTSASVEFNFNANTSAYAWNGSVVYSGNEELVSSGGSDGWQIGQHRVGANVYQRGSITLNETDSLMYYYGFATGDEGAIWSGGHHTSDTSEEIDSITIFADGEDLPAGCRLTVYKVTR